MSEPVITINGAPLDSGQAMAIRVAILSFWQEVGDEDALGNDCRGLTRAYRERLTEVIKLMLAAS